MTTLRTIWYAITGAKKFRVLRPDGIVTPRSNYHDAHIYAEWVGGTVINAESYD